MKRHNAKAIAAAVAIAAAAATAESKKKAEPTKPSLSTSTLYVDVVKNMAKMESKASVTPPPPKFTILHEDFPALPGTQEDLQVAVPDDWTAMISDDDDQDDVYDDNDNDGDADAEGDDDGDDNDDDEVQSAQSSLMVVNDQVEPETVAVPDLLVELELKCVVSDVSEVSQSSSESSSEHENEVTAPVAAAVALVAATTDYNSKNNNNNIAKDEIEPNFFQLSNNYNNNCGIFDKQFLSTGVAQRVWQRQRSAEATANIGPPPGFENIKFYGRLRTNRLGVPMGGVAFDMAPPQIPAQPPPPPTPQNPSPWRWHKPSAGIDGAYGLAGLANNLKTAQQTPQTLTQMLGHDGAGLNVDAHRCACEANKLHASFAGPLNGGCCAPHEVNCDVPLYYQRAGGQDLPQPKMEQMQAELLFFFFYTYPGDMMQMLAAAELAERGWRFHIYERLWIRPQPDNPHYMRRGLQESGEYNYFNMVHWKILARHFFLQPDQLERTLTKAELREQYGYHPQMSFF